MLCQKHEVSTKALGTRLMLCFYLFSRLIDVILSLQEVVSMKYFMLYSQMYFFDSLFVFETFLIFTNTNLFETKSLNLIFNTYVNIVECH